ncbi:extracellular solute-binding protein [Cohnella sp. REN36]|uniref:extracellular solute-binding protein n=1 Tax=Cohnella sp. REN36 TaxID=2887347 RepID=UPI001D14D778|nr:extracellular solute-binding protein [Cohnella sp. REN36]
MARRKTVLIILALGLMVLLVSPWASAPSSKTPPAALPANGAEATPPAPAEAEEAADLRAVAVADEADFATLEKQNAKFALRYPDIRVTLTRVDPKVAGPLLDSRLDDGRAADLALVPGEWVKTLAVSGAILPADAAFVGEALSDQFNAVAAPLKWNDYTWGVPRSMDPYVLVWNRNVLGSLRREDGSPLDRPQRAEDWEALPKRLRDAGSGAAWLALDASDPFAVMSWLGAAAGERADVLPGDQGKAWTGQALEGLLAMPPEDRLGIRAEAPDAAFWASFAAGGTLAAVVRHSVATAGIAALPKSDAEALEIDRTAWQRPFIWTAGESFVLSARTLHEEAARTWMAYMTDAAHQLENYEETGRLPAYPSLYTARNGVSPNLANVSLSSFPNQAPSATGPEVPIRLRRLTGLWEEWLDGRIGVEAWKQRWPASFAEFEANG